MTEFNGVQVGGHTLVGYMVKEFPIPGSGGNCFDIIDEKFTRYRIINFGLENLEELLRRGLTWPIKCRKIGEGLAVVCDGRIGDRWYATNFCEVCTPTQLIPIPQRLVQLRAVARGNRVEKTTPDGMTIVSVTLGSDRKPAEFE